MFGDFALIAVKEDYGNSGITPFIAN